MKNSVCAEFDMSISNEAAIPDADLDAITAEVVGNCLPDQIGGSGNRRAGIAGGAVEKLAIFVNVGHFADTPARFFDADGQAQFLGTGNSRGAALFLNGLDFGDHPFPLARLGEINPFENVSDGAARGGSGGNSFLGHAVGGGFLGTGRGALGLIREVSG